MFPFFSHLHDAAIIPMIDPIIKDFSLNRAAEEKANKASPAPFASFKFSTNGSKVMY